MRLGYIKLARQLLEHPIWTTERFTRGAAWVDLLLLAQFTPYSFRIRGNLIELDRGQIGHSKSHLAGRWKWDRKTVQRFLDDLENDGMITQQKTKVVTIVTVVNYGTWQGFEDDQEATGGQQNPHQNGQQNGQQNPQQTGQQKGHKEEGKERGKKVKKAKKNKGGREKTGVLFENLDWPAELDTPECHSTWARWIKYKADIKDSYKSPESATGQLKRWKSKGPDRFIAAVEYTIAQSYKGIIEEGGNGKPTATQQPQADPEGDAACEAKVSAVFAERDRKAEELRLKDIEHRRKQEAKYGQP
jgi:hypothetical protein